MSGEIRNLLTGTRDWSGDWVNAEYFSKSGTHDGFVVMRRDAAWKGLYKPVVLTAGTTYTFSAMARVPAGKPAHIFLSNGGTVNDTYLANSEFSGYVYESVCTGDGDWFEIHLTFTPTASKAVSARIEADDSYAIEVCAYMLVEGTTPAAWAPAEGESLAGGGAQMSANIWSDSTASMQVRADGTYLVGKSGTAELTSNVTGLASLTENQTVHMGASLKGAGAGVLKPFVEYKDAAGNLNWVGFPSWQPTDSWQRFEGTCVVPSGMTVCGVGFDASGATGDIEVLNPVFNYGSTGIVMAAGSVTVASINDVASTARYYLLQSSTLAAPSKPTASPPGGSWQVTEPTYTEGSTNSLYFVDETIFSDGTWAYSAVSLSTSYEAAKAAYNKASSAAQTAAALSKLIRETDDGVDVGKSADGTTYADGMSVTRQGTDGSFSILKALAGVLTKIASFSETEIDLGSWANASAKNNSAVIKFFGGSGRITFEIGGTRDLMTISSGDLKLSGNSISLLIDTYLCINDSSIPVGRVISTLQPVVNRDSGVISDYGSAVAHYTKIGTWKNTVDSSILKIRVMTGRGYSGNSTQNSSIDIFIKKSNTTSGTTGAFGVTYELHNANSAMLAPYVVATAYNRCDIWIKNSLGYESGWYIAEYNSSTWSDGGSAHQTDTPSGTAQNTACTGAAVYSGTKIVNATNPDFNLFSDAEVNAIIGHSIDGKTDTITVCSGDDSSYRGIMTASIQPSGNIVIRCDPAPGGWIRVNYIIATS